MQVLKSDVEDGVAKLTISIGDDDHRFEIWSEDDTALIEYQETLTWRGQVEVSEPDEEVLKELVTSDEVTEFLDEHACTSTRLCRCEM